MNGGEIEALCDALCEAFTLRSLDRMLLTRLDKRREAIVAGADLGNVTFDLVTLAEREGWTADLVAAAVHANPRSLALRRFCDTYPQFDPPGWPTTGADGRPQTLRGGREAIQRFALSTVLVGVVLVAVAIGLGLPTWSWWVGGAVMVMVVAVALGVPGRTTPSPHPVPPPTALKFLSPYGPGEAELFRLLQRDQIRAACLAFAAEGRLRFGILTGESGCGKTSFLQAGLGPALAARRQHLLYVKLTHRPPVVSLRHAVAEAEFVPDAVKSRVGEAAAAGPALRTLIDGLRAAGECSAERPLVVVFDQFEQLFALPQHAQDEFARELDSVLHLDQCEHLFAPPRPLQDEFARELAAWYRPDDELPVKVLVSVRDDRMGKLTPFQQALRYTLEPMNNLRLEKFSPAAAERAFVAVVSAAGIECDPDFVNDDLVPALTDGGSGQVSPVDIQVLAWVVSQQDDPALRKFDRATYQRLGGIEGLLEKHLKDAMRSRGSADRQRACTAVLAALCDFETAQRAGAKTLEDLCEAVEYPPGVVTDSLDWLASSGVRLVTPVGEPEGAFEVIHEQIIPAVRRLVHALLDEVARADTLLSRRANEWVGNNRDPRYLLTRRETRLIRRHAAQLTWGANRWAKEALLKASRRRHRRASSLRAGVAAVVPLVALSIGVFARTDYRWVWQARRDVDHLVDRSTDPQLLLKVAAMSEQANDRQRGEVIRRRARQVAESTTDSNKRSDALVAVASAWAERDPGAATAWAEGLPAGRGRLQALEEVARIWASTDPPLAVAWAKQLTSVGDRNIALVVVAGEWAKSRPEAGAALAESIEDGDSRDSAFLAVSGECAKRHPEMAAAVAGKIAQVRVRDRARAQVARESAQRDVKTAAGLVKEISDPDQRDAALVVVLGELAKTDPLDARAAAGAISRAEFRERAYLAIARETAASTLR